VHLTAQLIYRIPDVTFRADFQRGQFNMLEQKITYLKEIAILIEEKISEMAAKLELQPMPHMPTLGSGYEAISKTTLETTLKEKLHAPVYLSEGFVRIAGEMAGQQIDIILSSKPGEQYGNTASFIHNIEDVLCIIEVKKTLDKSSFTDSMQHLTVIKDSYIDAITKGTIPLNFAAVDHARNVVSILKHAPLLIEKKKGKINLTNLTLPEEVLFWSFYLEWALPPYIVHGFDGYKTEQGLQNAFSKYVDNKDIKKRWITYIPSLVMSGKLSIVKATGNPFFYKEGEEVSVFFMSANSLPMELMLMIIVNRMVATGLVDKSWGSIYTENSFCPFLKAIVNLEVLDRFSARFTRVLFKRNNILDEAYRLKNTPPPGKIGPAATNVIQSHIFNLLARERGLFCRVPFLNDIESLQALEEIERLGIPVDLEGFMAEVDFAFRANPSDGTAIIDQSISKMERFVLYYPEPVIDAVLRYKNGKTDLKLSERFQKKIDRQIDDYSARGWLISEEIARKYSLI
jgi:hypothetical protein